MGQSTGLSFYDHMVVNAAYCSGTTVNICIANLCRIQLINIINIAPTYCHVKTQLYVQQSCRVRMVGTQILTTVRHAAVLMAGAVFCVTRSPRDHPV